MFEKRLVLLRKNKKISQYELAKLLNLTRGQIANYEQGKRQPDYDILKMFAEYFNVSTDYLLGNSDDPESNQVVDHEILRELEEATKEMYKAIDRYLKIANRLKTIEKHSAKRK